jgi:hypothetical protein
VKKLQLKLKEQAQLNELKKLFDTKCRSDINAINMNPSTSKKHQERINKICLTLMYDIKTPFFTDVTFKTGYRPDIFCPLYLGGAFIEVRDSETSKKSAQKQDKIPEELCCFITIYSDVKNPFELKQIQ